jgi:hypothetical protein
MWKTDWDTSSAKWAAKSQRKNAKCHIMLPFGLRVSARRCPTRHDRPLRLPQARRPWQISPGFECASVYGGESSGACNQRALRSRSCIYEFKVDTNGDAVADLAYRVQFASSGDGKQTATLRRIHRAQATGVGNDGEVIVKEALVSVGWEALVTKAGNPQFW